MWQEKPKGSVLELQQVTRPVTNIKTTSVLSTDQSPQTNFRLVKKFPNSEEKKSPKYTLEVKAPSPKRSVDAQQSTPQQTLNKNEYESSIRTPNNESQSSSQMNTVTNSAVQLQMEAKKTTLMKKKELTFLPPPEYFKKKRLIKTINLAQWKAQSVLRILPGKSEKQEETKYEDLDDFTSLLTKKLFENLDESDVVQGSYTVKEGSYCLIIQQEKSEKKKDENMMKEVDKKNKHLEEMLPGPCFGLVKTDEKRLTFNRDEVLRFELQYKDILYDTYIKVGRFYQAYVPEIKPCKAFLRSEVIFGLPPKNQQELKPPKLTIEYKQRNRIQKEKEKQLDNKYENAMDLEEPQQPEVSKTGSYVHNDEFKGEPIVESIYVSRRLVSEYLEWDPELAQDPEVLDMVGQVMEDFKDEPRITKGVLNDYLKLCRLNKERFLDHLEMDHDDFKKYIHMILHKGG